MNNLGLPSEKRAAIVGEFGDSGLVWCDQFDELLQALCARWQLRLKRVATAGLAINMVYFGENYSGQARVLKVGYPIPELFTEMKALAVYRSRGIVQLLDKDESAGAMLLEAITPGSTFRDCQGRQPGSATSGRFSRSAMPIRLFSDLPQTIRQAEEVAGLPALGEWVERAFTRFRQSHSQPHEFFDHAERAENLFAELAERYPDQCLLHGDLHHENILLRASLNSPDEDWVAIDPKGVIGPAIFECGRYLHNFLEDEFDAPLLDLSVVALSGLISYRLKVMASVTQHSVSDLAVVAYVDCVLSTCWTLNSGGDGREGMHRIKACLGAWHAVNRGKV